MARSERGGWRIFQGLVDGEGQPQSWRAFRATMEQSHRKSGGWRAQKAGASAEVQVMRAARRYLEEERAELTKRAEPYRRIGAAKANGHFTAAPLSKSGPDFELALPDGRAGLLEVKSRRGDRIPLDAIGEVQAAALHRRQLWGGFAAVVVMLWDERSSRWWVVDWRRWSGAQAHGMKSFKGAQLDELGVRCALTLGGEPDWLPALLRASEEASKCPWPGAGAPTPEGPSAAEERPGEQSPVEERPVEPQGDIELKAAGSIEELKGEALSRTGEKS